MMIVLGMLIDSREEAFISFNVKYHSALKQVFCATLVGTYAIVTYWLSIIIFFISY